ncbi:MAG: undecaprenyl-diphosphate phosphatase [Promethearchaeota archaeon]|nr:MAG: undecaprenyl-diphosphate phosphatase [Candidatus Lokiarchaeota archaeon]
MIEYIIIAILQGLIEWLPISSSGQVMIVAINFFGISPEEAFSLSIWLHLGTAFAVILKFRSEFVKIMETFFPKTENISEIDIKRRNWLIFATIGTAITALPLYFLFKVLLITEFSGRQGDIITLVISGSLIITGMILLKTKKSYGDNDLGQKKEINLKKDALMSGLVQGIAILPGISRSGMTISAILLKNYDQDTALRLSFLMSVPAVFASIFVDIIFGEGSVFALLEPLTIIIITLVSFVVGYLTLEILLKLAKKVNFGYFCIIYGMIAFVIIVPFLLVA